MDKLLDNYINEKNAGKETFVQMLFTLIKRRGIIPRL